MAMSSTKPLGVIFTGPALKEGGAPVSTGSAWALRQDIPRIAVPTSGLGSAQILLPLAGKVRHMQIESDALTLGSFFRRSA
jgi:hypothetical protein